MEFLGIYLHLSNKLDKTKINGNLEIQILIELKKKKKKKIKSFERLAKLNLPKFLFLLPDDE